jgi:hypothetical protein
MNKAPGLPLSVGLMGELIENKKVGHKVSAEGFKGLALDPSARGGECQVKGFPVFVAGLGGMG